MKKTVALALTLVLGIFTGAFAQNNPLGVGLTNPTNNTTLIAPATIALAATVTNTPANIAKVEFYSAATKLGEAATSPYLYIQVGTPPGLYSFTAVATDNLGVSSTSAPVAVTIQATGPDITNALPNPGGLTGYRGQNYKILYFTVTSSASGPLWGTDVYTDDSSLAVAAVHAGVLQPGATGIVKVTVLPGVSSYVSTSRHGITSSAYGSWVGSYSVEPPLLPTVPPAIAVQPVGRTISTGAALALSATVQGGLPISFQWQLNGTNVAGALTPSLVIPGITLQQGGGYTLIATNSAGSVTSLVAQVTVVPNSLPAISLVVASNNPAFIEPATVPLVATASDANGSVTNVDFYWGSYRIGSVTNAPYQFNWENLGKGTYQVYAVATDDSGTTNLSNGVTITVAPRTAPVTTGLANPGSLTGYRGKAGQVFYFQVTGAIGGGVYGDQYYTDDSSLASVAVHSGVLDEGETGIVKVTILGAQSSYAATTRNGITSTGYGAWPGSYSMDAPIPTTVPPNLVLQPVGVVRSTGSSYTFKVRAIGGHPLRYEWRQNGVIPLGVDVQDRDLVLKNLALFDAGIYRVVVTNAAGSIPSLPVNLTVVPNTLPSVAMNSPAPGATFSEPATVPLGATASDQNGSVTRVDFYWGSYWLGSATNAPWTFNWENVGQGSFSVRAVATDDSGTSNSSAGLVVTVGPRTAPVINPTAAPGNMTGYRGRYGTVYYYTVTGATNGTLWGTDVYTDDSYLPTAAVHSGALTNGQTGVIRVAILPGLGSYASTERFGIRSTAYGVWSGSYSVSALEGGVVRPVVALTSPVDGASPKAGDIFILAATASEPGGVIDHVDFLDGGTVVATLTSSPYTTNWSSGVLGTHLLSARAYDGNGVSVVSSPVQINVLPSGTTNRPVIVQDPQPQTVFVGGSATFTVVATGAESYQWKKGVSPILGAVQSTLTLQNVTTDSTGNYSVDVINAVGTVTSKPAHLGVLSTQDGDWSQQSAILANTPEADLMVRTGDIDNLGFGWPPAFNPFSGNTTPGHGFPWVVDPADAPGTDRIMVPSSYNGNPPAGGDGYTATTSRPANLPQAITLSYAGSQFSAITVNSAILQLFVDDFQAPVWQANYQVKLNGVRAPFLESIINGLVQTGPVGRLITVQVPAGFIPLIRTGTLEILIDDPTTGAADGYAIDFVKLLINPRTLAQVGTVNGNVAEAAGGAPIGGVTVSASGLALTVTDTNGNYTLTNVPAGLVTLTASLPGYATQSKSVDLISGQSAMANFTLTRVPPQLIIRREGTATTSIVVSWPANAIGFVLQQSFSLGAGAGWSTLAIAPVVVNGNNTVTVPFVAGGAYYRLLKAP